jgi:uncharacterized membrane protein YdjX (TVP38/TMEM64 family)
MKKFLTAALMILIIALGYWQKDQFIAWIEAGGMFSVLISILFVAILVFFPIMPFFAVAGIIGAVFGTWEGSLISLTGAVFGALVMFAMARFGFREWIQGYIQKYPKAKEYEGYFERNAFWSILFFRVVPVIPSPLINILSGVSRVPWYVFLTATFLGKIPSILVFTFVGSQFGESKTTSFVTFGIYMVAIFIATFVYLRKQELKKQ